MIISVGERVSCQLARTVDGTTISKTGAGGTEGGLIDKVWMTVLTRLKTWLSHVDQSSTL